MSERLRPVAPINAAGLSLASPAGPPPELVWLALDRLVINDSYQRHISEKSVTLIRRMAERFDWARVKALSVAALEDGHYEVIDGQHTAIAAATLGLAELPCLVTRGRGLAERSADFVSLNRDRLSMTPMQVFYAELAAGEELAQDVARGVGLAGGRVLRYPPPFAKFAVGDALCVGQLRALARAGGVAYVKRAVAICVEGQCAPVKAVTLKALQALIWGKAGPGALPARQGGDLALAEALKRHGQEGLIAIAMRRRETSGQPLAAALADVLRINAAEAA